MSRRLGRRHLHEVGRRGVEGAIAADAKVDPARPDQRVDRGLDQPGFKALVSLLASDPKCWVKITGPERIESGWWDQADARRAEIILNGLSADVVQSTENGKVWYRVVSGPYDSQEAAVIAQQTLQHSGIDSIVVKR